MGFVVLACPPHDTDGKDAEKFGNLEGRGGGFVGCPLSWVPVAV